MDDPVKLSPRQLVSATKLVRNLAEFLNKSKEGPIFIMRKEEVEFVLLSIEEYRKLLIESEKG